MNRLLTWCAQPSSAVIWRPVIFLNLRLRCRSLVASGAANLLPKLPCHGGRSPLGGNVEPSDGARVTSTGKNIARAAVRVCGESQCSITMQITALQLLCRIYVASHKIKPMLTRELIVNQTNCCIMLVFHKLTVLSQLSLSPTRIQHHRSHMQHFACEIPSVWWWLFHCPPPPSESLQRT